MRPPCLVLMLATGVLCLLPSAAITAEQRLDEAVQILRNIDPQRMSEEEREQKSEEIGTARETLQNAGQPATRRLKAELAAIRKADSRDDRFSLAAAALLWKINGIDEVQTIAEIWRTSNLDVQYNYVLVPAVLAARTRDPRVLPMLKTLLRDKRGTFFVPQHYLMLEWPLTQRFIWGAYGSQALPVLEQTLTESENGAELETAMVLLASSFRTSALPRIRELASHQDSDVRSTALQCLGIFGHPQDYELLARSCTAENLARSPDLAYGLGLYEDLRLADELVPFLHSDTVAVRKAVLGALRILPCPASLEAIHAWADEASIPQERMACAARAAELLHMIDLDWEAYAALDEEERDREFRDAREADRAEFVLKPDDRTLTRKQFLRATEEWKSQNGITGGAFEWVEDRHILSVAAPQDIPLLIDVRARVYERISDEALIEVAILDRLIKHLARATYRDTVGCTPKVTR